MGDVAIGIDLGTTYCCMSVYRDGRVEIIPKSYDTNTTPSYVHIDENDSVTAGPAAKGLAPQDLTRSVYDVKRLIGRRFNDPVVQKDMEMWPFNLIEDEDTHLPRISVNGTAYAPEQISAHVLIYLKECAEKWLNRPVKKAVITVPAYFNDLQRQATKLAGSIAGLDVLKLLHEPTAAALYYCYKNKSFQTEKTVLVFDLGGGTFDVVVMKIKDRKFEIKAIGGDSHLGGQDIDRNLVDHCLQEFKAKNGIDLSSVVSGRDKVKVARLLRRLKNECEEIKTQLSYNKKSVISLDNLHGDTSLVVKITREEFDNLNDSLYQQCVNTVKAVVKEAKLTPGDIDEIIMVGGSSRIPRLQELIMRLFQDKKPNRTINADEAVACGAAIQAALMTVDCPVLKNIFPDIKIRDAVSLPVDTNPFTTVVTDTPHAGSVFNEHIEIHNLKMSLLKSNRQVGKSESNSGKEAPKPILRNTNVQPDAVFVQLEMIENGVIKNDINKLFRAWENIKTLTKETPGNCGSFLEHRGIEIFLKCLNAFPNDVVLEERCLLSLMNVAKVEHLRPQLMISELINVIYNFLESTKDKNWVSYYAAFVIIQILLDGVVAWTIKSPRRADVLSGIRRSVKRWEEDRSTHLYVSSSWKLYLELLNATHTTECQLFAVWSLNHPTKYWLPIASDNLPRLVKEGGVDFLNKMRSEDEDVQKYVNMALEAANKYLSRNIKV